MSPASWGAGGPREANVYGGPPGSIARKGPGWPLPALSSEVSRYSHSASTLTSTKQLGPSAQLPKGKPFGQEGQGGWLLERKHKTTSLLIPVISELVERQKRV